MEKRYFDAYVSQIIERARSDDAEELVAELLKEYGFKKFSEGYTASNLEHAYKIGASDGQTFTCSTDSHRSGAVSVSGRTGQAPSG